MKCLDSEYLQKKDLHLLRLLAVEDYFPGKRGHSARRVELTPTELAMLLPLFVARQFTGSDSRNAAKLKKQRADIVAKLQEETTAATQEHDGMIWLMDHNVSVDNVLYYSHTDKFCFGWRSKLDQEVVDALLEMISEFPFAYEIKGIKRTWEGC